MGHHRLLTEALRTGFGSCKELAVAGGFSVKTATRYRTGETLPDVITLARLMGRSRVVAEAMLRMAGLDDLSLDQEQARLVRALSELEAKREARNAALAQAYAVAGREPPAAVRAALQPRLVAAGAAAGSDGDAAAPARAR